MDLKDIFLKLIARNSKSFIKLIISNLELGIQEIIWIEWKWIMLNLDTKFKIISKIIWIWKVNINIKIIIKEDFDFIVFIYIF